VTETPTEKAHSEQQTSTLAKPEEQTQTVVHPSLKPFYVINTGSNARIFANTSVAYPLDTDYFKGQMRILIRTPDVDDIENENPNPHPTKASTDENGTAVQFFRGKQRRFEFQFRVKLKRVPTGRLYFSFELQESVKMGMIQRAFVGAAMAFIKTTNKSFHYSLNGSSECADGRYEPPHMAFPVEEGMNRVLATPPGQTPPPLGGEIPADAESIKRRKKVCV
jgi:hypothetical protein